MELNKFLQAVAIEVIGHSLKLQRLHYNLKVSVGKSWELSKTYADFLNFRRALEERCPLIPELPDIKLIEVKPEQSQHRLRAVESFLHDIVIRQDIVLTQLFRQFFSLPFSILQQQPTILAQDTLLPKTTSIQIITHQNVVFHLLAKNSMTSKIGNILGGFFSALKPTDAQGYLVCYTVIDKPPYLRKQWQQIFGEVPKVMSFDKGSNLLGIGLISGQIQILLVSSQDNYKSFKRFSKLKFHKSQIMGLAFHVKAGFLYSAAKDKVLFSTNIRNDQKVDKKIVLSSQPSHLLFLRRREILAVCQARGQVTFFNSNSSGHLQSQGVLDTKFQQPFLQLKTDLNQKFLFLLIRGYILILDLLEPGKEKYSSIYSVIQVSDQSTCFSLTLSPPLIVYNYRRNAIVISTTGKFRESINQGSQNVTSLVKVAQFMFTGGEGGQLIFSELKKSDFRKTFKQEQEQTPAQISIPLPPKEVGKSQPTKPQKSSLPPKRSQMKVLPAEEDDLSGWDR